MIVWREKIIIFVYYYRESYTEKKSPPYFGKTQDSFDFVFCFGKKSHQKSMIGAYISLLQT